MKEFTYRNFLRGEQVTIREILEERRVPEEDATYFVLLLNQTDEPVKIKIGSKDASLIKTNIALFYALESKDAKGDSLWKNGNGSFGIKLP